MYVAVRIHLANTLKKKKMNTEVGRITASLQLSMAFSIVSKYKVKHACYIMWNGLFTAIHIFKKGHVTAAYKTIGELQHLELKELEKLLEAYTWHTIIEQSNIRFKQLNKISLLVFKC